ncbi:DUF3048 domain-containing protein [Streptomyces sp. P38-E01]|uniref:DUF3048 domain-containing protein n=1 Tax=Streptomyces tardus TaxID=2780544 RepID=A0A949JPY2_9ACTN|nr:DUF3048 domain-containing protein [Streptomyces tardus]MBU7598105.1 DUF3048 domain-containing protein [Streptomyces tardus]
MSRTTPPTSAEPRRTGGRVSRRRLVLALAATGTLLAGTAATSYAGEDTATPAEQTSPFTGLPAEPAPVLAVKIDNASGARPHTNVEDADMVYVEKVEGGMSRLIGIYSSQLPDTIGPVRSAREYNAEQLQTFDRPALAYSGAQKGVDEILDKSPIFNLSNDNFPSAFRRADDRPAPHNLYVDPQAILDEAGEASLSADIGLRFGDRPEGGEPTEERTVNYGTAEIGVKWSAEEERWLASFDGEPAMSTDGEQLGGKTVVVQKVDMPPSDFQDPTNTTPFIETVGEGEATVLRDGEAFETTWKRDNEKDGTTYTLPNGEPMPFDPGQTWVVYEER